VADCRMLYTVFQPRLADTIVPGVFHNGSCGALYQHSSLTERATEPPLARVRCSRRHGSYGGTWARTFSGLFAYGM
jgi:hypothetical protein